MFPVKYYCSVLTGENEGRTKYSVADSLPSKRFRLVSEQKKTVEGDFWFWSREKLKFDSCSSFFAPKPHRNASYAGYAADCSIL